MIPQKSDDEPRLIVNKSPKEAGPVSARSRAFSFVEVNHLSSHAVYTLSEDDTKAAKWQLKSVTIQYGEMLALLGP